MKLERSTDAVSGSDNVFLFSKVFFYIISLFIEHEQKHFSCVLFIRLKSELRLWAFHSHEWSPRVFASNSEL